MASPLKVVETLAFYHADSASSIANRCVTRGELTRAKQGFVPGKSAWVRFAGTSAESLFKRKTAFQRLKLTTGKYLIPIDGLLSEGETCLSLPFFYQVGRV